ncbi:MAG: sigma 54-interacting transcriptional regulator [Kofleriaceae bacterium]
MIGEGLFATHALPNTGVVTIGRSPECAIRIDLPAISREHAAVHVTGSALHVQDLGSSNGTRVRGQLLERSKTIELYPGDIIELGSTMVMVQHFTGDHPSKRVWTHDYFEWRVEDECERSSRTGLSFTLARIRIDNPPPSESLATLLLDRLRPGDHIAEYGPQDYELLLPNTATTESERLVTELCASLETAGMQTAYGLAAYGRDGRTSQVLIEKAAAALVEAATDEVVYVETGVMIRLHRMVERIAQGEINVLILGETGSGKEVMAQRIHALSPRASKPIVAINCAALSESLLESELFGHERGAFTGAVAAKRGLLEAAEGGTVFLDEMGDLPLPLQAKLLRVIEERQVRRVGGVTSFPIDVRFLAATHRDLETEVERGSFRQDLFFRLNGISVVVPPLRERQDEIEPLARSFINQICARTNRPAPELSPSARDALTTYRWPGNVRELRNVIERAVLLCGDGPISIEHVPIGRMRARSPSPNAEAHVAVVRPTEKLAQAENPPGWTDLRSGLESHERKLLIDALEKCNGNQTAAAKLLGISRRTMLNRIAAYGLPRPRKDKQSNDE